MNPTARWRSWAPGGKDPVHVELLSYLLCPPDFTRELLALGPRGATGWLDQGHDDGPWRTASPSADRMTAGRSERD